MSIQSSINQGILATAALASQNPEFQEKKKEAAYEKKLEGTLENLQKAGRVEPSAIKAIQSGNEQLLYDQLKRFKERVSMKNDYYTLKESKLSEAQEHYKKVGDLKNYFKYSRELKELPGKRASMEMHNEDVYRDLRQAYKEARYRNEGSGYEETNRELDRAEQIQANTNNFHKMLKNKSKVDVVGERNGK